MPVRPHPKESSFVSALSWRAAAQRYSYILFIGLALALLVFGRVRPEAVDAVRMRTIDTLAPALDAFSRPMLLAQNAMDRVGSYFAVREENMRLRAENAQAKDWQNEAVALEKENRALHALLNFKVEPGFAYISARVIADTGGAFARGLIVTAGRLDGVREGMAAMTGDGLIGRVVEVGDWSSRVMLITDLNSRVPVMIAHTSDRAILAGDNSPTPKLLYLPPDAVVAPGARVVTSGHGGVFPPDLPVGFISAAHARGTTELVPAANPGRVDYVRLVDFNLKGGTFNPLANRINAEGKNAYR